MSGHGNGHLNPLILYFPTEVLQLCFGFLVSYVRDLFHVRYDDKLTPDQWLMKRKRTSIADLANVARVCKTFHSAVLPVLYRQLESLTQWQDNLRSNYEQISSLFQTLSEHSGSVASLVRSVHIDSPVPDVASLSSIHPYGANVRAILFLVHQSLVRARLELRGCTIGGGSLRSLNLLALKYMMIQSNHRTFIEPDDPLDVVLSWAPNLTTLFLRKINCLFLISTDSPKSTMTHLVSLTMLDSQIVLRPSYNRFVNSDSVQETLFEKLRVRSPGGSLVRSRPLADLLSRCPNLQIFRINPMGHTYYKELIEDAAPWERSAYPERYEVIALDGINIDEDTPTVVDNPAQERGLDRHHPGLNILDALRAASFATTTLKEIHLGDIKELRGTSAAAPAQLIGSLPKVTFLSIHCANLVLSSEHDGRDIATEVFDSCPRLESLEITGINKNLNGTLDKVLAIAQAIGRRHHCQKIQKTDPAPFCLKRVVLCSEEDDEEFKSLRRFMCDDFCQYFTRTGVELVFIKRITDF